MKSVELLGCLMIGNAISIAGWWILASKPNLPYAIGLFSFVAFLGLILVFYERVTEVTMTQFGSIKLAAAQATGDAHEIANLKSRIEGQAATVDLVAQKASEAERLTRELTLKNEAADKKLAEIEGTLKEAENNVAKLDAVAEFTSTVVAVQNDDREALDRLEAWAEDPNYPFSERAKKAFRTAIDISAKPFRTSWRVPWNEGVDPTQLTLGDLQNTFNVAANNNLKCGVLQLIGSRGDLPLKQKLEFFVGVMSDTKSVLVAEEAGAQFTKGAGLKIKPLAIKYVRNWWAENNGRSEEELRAAAEGAAQASKQASKEAAETARKLRQR